MDAQLDAWKRAADALWSAATFDYREAARLTADIARQSEEPSLRERAAQALPGLRTAAARGADRYVKDVARRRFALVRDALYALTGPRFGKRRGAARLPTPEEHHRRLLGLPLGRRLFGPEIQQAYRRAAKTLHPDSGGSGPAFRELAAARDALLKNI
jgi:hypothetical protein